MAIYKHSDLSDINRLYSYLLNLYTRFKPKFGLIAIVVSMMAGLLAIGLPLVVTGISRILDRYQSEVISRILQKRWEYKLSIYTGITVVIILCIIGTCIEESAEIIGFWKILYCVNLILFFTFLSSFLLLFFSAIKYSNDSKYILQKFGDSNHKILRFLEKKGKISSKKLDLIQKQLLDNLEGIGDILSFLSPKSKYNLYVIQQLDELSFTTKKFISLIKQHPERFALLSFSDDYSKIFLKHDRGSLLKKSILDHFPENNYVVFSSLIKQISRTHRQAFIHKNLKIALETIRFVIRSLEYLSIQPEQEAVINYYLTELYYREFDCNKEEDLEHYKTIDIYFQIVFKNRFKLEYLHLFDYFLFEQFKYIVNKNQVKLVDNILVSATQNSRIFFDYKESSITNSKKIENFRTKLNNISLISEIDKCCNEFDRLAELDDNKQEMLQYRKDFHLLVVEYYKYNHLKDLIFALGAYCVCQRKFSLIHWLWEFNQPQDSTANILDRSIVPIRYGELLNFYFSEALTQRTLSIYWDRNHNKERYYRLYFILALVRSFSTSTALKTDVTEVSLEWNLLSLSRINYIHYEINNILGDFRFLEQYEQQFVDLEFSINQVNWIIFNKVQPLLIHLKNQTYFIINRSY